MRNFKNELKKLAIIKNCYNLETHCSKNRNQTVMIGVVEGKAVSISIDYAAKTIFYKSVKHGTIIHYCF